MYKNMMVERQQTSVVIFFGDPDDPKQVHTVFKSDDHKAKAHQYIISKTDAYNNVLDVIVKVEAVFHRI